MEKQYNPIDGAEDLFDQLIVAIAEEAAYDAYEEALVKDPSLKESEGQQLERFYQREVEPLREAMNESFQSLKDCSAYLGKCFDSLDTEKREHLVEEFNKIQLSENGAEISEETTGWIIAQAKEAEEQQDYTNAKNIYYFLLMIEPRNASFWFSYGNSLRELENWEKAIEAFTISHIFDPSIHHCRYYAAICYLQLSLPEDAKLMLEELQQELTDETREAWETPVNELFTAIGG